MSPEANKLFARLALGTAIVVGLAAWRGAAASNAPLEPSPRRARAWTMPRLSWGGAPAVVVAARDAAITEIEQLDGGPEPEPDDPYPLGPLSRAIVDQVCGPATDVLCAARDRCACGSEPVSEEPCAASARALCEQWVRCRWSWLEEIEAEPELALDPGAVRGCVAGIALASTSCRSVVLGEDCDHLIVESAGVGEPCSDGLCMGGYCNEGTCVPRPRDGEPCPEWLCAAGSTCEDERCVEAGARGTRCGSDLGCAFELACLDGTCRSRRDQGGRCESDSHCAIGARCSDGHCERADRCDLLDGCGDGRTCAGEEVARCVRPRVGRGREGESCALGCASGLGCAADRCARLPLRSEACLEGRCADELRCVLAGDRPVCAAGTLGAGASCMVDPSVFCASGLDCLYDFAQLDYRCVPRIPEDSDCSTGSCAAGLTCIWGVLDGVCRASICDPLALFGCGEE